MSDFSNLDECCTDTVPVDWLPVEKVRLFPVPSGGSDAPQHVRSRHLFAEPEVGFDPDHFKPRWWPGTDVID